MQQLWIVCALTLAIAVGYTHGHTNYSFSCFGSNCTEILPCNITINGYQLVAFNMKELLPRELFDPNCDQSRTVCARNNGVYRVTESGTSAANAASLIRLLRRQKLNALHGRHARSGSSIHVSVGGRNLVFTPEDTPCQGPECTKPFTWVTSVAFEGVMNYAPYHYTFQGPPTKDQPNETGYMNLLCYNGAGQRPPKRTRCYPVAAKN